MTADDRPYRDLSAFFFGAALAGRPQRYVLGVDQDAA